METNKFVAHEKRCEGWNPPPAPPLSAHRFARADKGGENLYSISSLGK